VHEKTPTWRKLGQPSRAKWATNTIALIEVIEDALLRRNEESGAAAFAGSNWYGAAGAAPSRESGQLLALLGA
jgi:hypothetical protein